MAETSDEKEFEERSDYIEYSDLELWNVENSHFASIQQKLFISGIKLLSGPRGTGKTHQMKIAHSACQKDYSKPLSIFVSFSKYYYLEPFLAKVPNAIQIFHTWMLSKIVIGCISSVKEHGISYEIFSENDIYLNENYIESFIQKAEKLRAEQLNDDPLIALLSISKVVLMIENLSSFLKRKRTILMLDDAALSLTPEYLIEFFDIVRSLKTKSISPKVSVYPGTTQYGPRFHIGQDAELVQCWMSVEDTTYLSFMSSIIEKRFAQYTDGVNLDAIEVFKYASFGVPRAFISLLRNFRSNNKRNILQNFNTVIEQQAKFIESEYLSISQKLVQYRKVIELGNKLFKRILDETKTHNATLKNEKNIIIGISKESMQHYKLSDRMLRFLIEAGLLYEDTSVKFGTQETGEKREYKRFIPHILFLIQNRTFSRSPSVSFIEISDRIKSKSSRHSIRRVLNKILTDNELNGLALDLPACQHCKTPRLSIDQRFCHICGQELLNKSIFEECLRISIDKIPITKWQKSKVKEAGFLTVGDFMHLQDPSSELRKIPQIGKFKSVQIFSEVMRTVDEFLE